MSNNREQKPRGSSSQNGREKATERYKEEQSSTRRTGQRRASGSGAKSSGLMGFFASKTKKEDGNVKLIGQTKKEVLNIVIGCVAAALIISFISIPILSDFFGLNQADTQAQVVVNEGDSVSAVVKNLKKTGIIKYPTFFKLYLGLSEKGYQFKAGEYVLSADLSYYEIIIKMRQINIQSSTVKITFWEGITQREIANLLESNKVCTAEAFHKYLDNVDITTLDYDFVNYISEDRAVFRPLEGYLFPDTYEFFVGEKASTVANKFLARFDQVIDEDMYTLMKERNMTLEDTIKLASIIEKECSSTEEAGKVSAVFHNRLETGSELPKLQSDVTIFYVNQDIKPFLNETDQPLYDSYNTYVCTGLPVGPICNPGILTIEAALNPEKTDDFYFFSDSEGEFFYSATYEEHTAKLKQASGEVMGTDTPKS